MLHNVLLIPKDRVSVEVGSGVEPKVDSLLPATYSIWEHIGLQNVGLSGHITQELEVNLIMVWCLRRKLH